MIIRTASLKDLPQILQIFNQAILSRSIAALEPVTIENRQAWFEDHSLDEYPILVAVSGDDVLGYMYLSAYRPGRTALRVTAEVSYFVDEDFHRQGVASALLGEAIHRCRTSGIKNLFAILLENNKRSISFLEKHGFQKWAHLPGVAEIDGKEVGQVYFGKRVLE